MAAFESKLKSELKLDWDWGWDWNETLYLGFELGFAFELLFELELELKLATCFCKFSIQFHSYYSPFRMTVLLSQPSSGRIQANSRGLFNSGHVVSIRATDCSPRLDHIMIFKNQSRIILPPLSQQRNLKLNQTRLTSGPNSGLNSTSGVTNNRTTTTTRLLCSPLEKGDFFVKEWVRKSAGDCIEKSRRNLFSSGRPRLPLGLSQVSPRISGREKS